MPLSRIQLYQGNPVPASATATGTVGQIAYDANYQYTCVATNTWVRNAITSWEPYFSYVALLSHFDGVSSVFVDSSGVNSLAAYGNATQSSTQSKFGGKSFYADGSSYLLANNVPQLTGDFVIEAWVYFTSIGSGYQTLWAHRSVSSGQGGALVALNGTDMQMFVASADGSTWAVPGNSSGLVASLSQWQHIALVRNGSTITLYKNGVGGTPATYGGAIYKSGQFSIMAGAADGAQKITGYMDELRVTVGSNRGYTANFSVPTAAFPNQ
jgi:hypothetical protein